MELKSHILVSHGTRVPDSSVGWNRSATLCFNVELECQIPPSIGTELRLFLHVELECKILRLVGTEVPIFSWRGTGVQSQCSDLGLAAFFPSLELECGTGVPSETGTPVPTKACDSIGSSQ